MFFLFKQKRKKRVYKNLDNINFCGKIENNHNVVIKFPEDPTLFSFSLPAARRIEDYFHGEKYAIFKERISTFLLRFLKHIKRFPESQENLKRFNFQNTILIDFELEEDKAGTEYPFQMRIGFKKELYPTLNIIYTIKEIEFPEYYEKVVDNIIESPKEVHITEPKTKRGWAWDYLKYLGMTQKKKVLIIDFNKTSEKLRNIIKEKHSDRWFLVFFNELHDVSIDQRIALLLIADRFIFDTSYYAYFATKEGINSYKIGKLPFKTSPLSTLKIIEEREVLQIIK